MKMAIRSNSCWTNLQMRFDLPMCPGLFNEAWLYVNGQRTAWREYREPWWGNDYKLQWDADITSRLQRGRNEIVIRGFNPHHYAGMFRRPFLYRKD